MTRPRKSKEVVPGLGGHLRRLRLLRDLTQEELGARAEVKAETVSRVENGVSTPDLDTLSRLAAALGVSLREVIPQADGPADEAASVAIAADWAKLSEGDRELVGALVMRLLRASGA